MQYGQNTEVNAMIEDVPALQGSEKQVAWGNEIRDQLMYRVALTAWMAQRELTQNGYEAGTPKYERRQRIIAAFQRMHDETSAGWWIDHNAPTGDTLINGLVNGQSAW